MSAPTEWGPARTSPGSTAPSASWVPRWASLVDAGPSWYVRAARCDGSDPPDRARLPTFRSGETPRDPVEDQPPQFVTSHSGWTEGDVPAHGIEDAHQTLLGTRYGGRVGRARGAPDGALVPEVSQVDASASARRRHGFVVTELEVAPR